MNNYKETTPALSTTWTTVLTLNMYRTALTLFNPSAVSVYIGLSEAGAVEIPAGKGLSFDKDTCPINAIGAKSASGTPTLVIWEA